MTGLKQAVFITSWSQNMPFQSQNRAERDYNDNMPTNPETKARELVDAFLASDNQDAGFYRFEQVPGLNAGLVAIVTVRIAHRSEDGQANGAKLLNVIMSTDAVKENK
jgi:hypothetical protein